MSNISKIILSQDDSILFAIKRAPHDLSKDGKLELPGGGLDKGETPLQGLIRELAEEEESGLVADKVSLLQLTPIKIMIEADGHFVYHMAVTEEELAKIQMNTTEHYGYRLIPRSTIISSQGMDPLVFTRRTVKIFYELKRLGCFPFDRL